MRLQRIDEIIGDGMAYRRASGRRRYLREQRDRMFLRRVWIHEIVKRLGLSYYDRGLPALVAMILQIHRVTAWRDLKMIKTEAIEYAREKRDAEIGRREGSG